MTTQPEQIKELLDSKFSNKKISDEFGFTGQYNLSVKDILDIIINLPTRTEIAQISEPVAPIDKILSAVQFLKDNAHRRFISNGDASIALEEFANLRVEQAKEEERQKIMKMAQRMSNGVDIVLLSDIENLNNGK